MTVKPTYCIRICKSSIRYRNELRKLSYSIDCLLGTTRYSPRRQTSSHVPSPGEQRNIRLVIDSAQFAPLCENMTSSTEPDVHNVFFTFMHPSRRPTNRADRRRVTSLIRPTPFHTASQVCCLRLPCSV